MTWASPHPSGPPTGKGPRGPKGEDGKWHFLRDRSTVMLTTATDRRVSQHNPNGRSRNRATNHRRRHHYAIDDGNMEAGDDGGHGDGGDGGGDNGGGY